MPFNHEKFLAILETAMNGNTKRDFALRCGITPESLSRYTRETNPDKPSRGTLRKIANHSAAKLEDLLSACGYTETPDNREIMDMRQRARLNIEDIEGGISQMLEECCLYDNIPAFLTEYAARFSHEKIKCAISEPKEYHGEWCPEAECSCIVSFTFGKRTEYCRTWIVLYYCETKGGKIVVCGFADDRKALVEAGLPADTPSSGMTDDDSCVFYIHGMPCAEMRLLERIFVHPEVGEKNTFMRSWVGFGFALPGVPANFSAFIQNHWDAFVESDAERSLATKCLSGKDPECLFAEYEDDHTGCTGYGAVVSKIMRAETGIPFGWWIDETGRAPVVMIENENGDYDCSGDHHALQQLVYFYAKELGVYEYGSVVVHCEYELDENDIYYIEENMPPQK